jgi:hypothetical protein
MEHPVTRYLSQGINNAQDVSLLTSQPVAIAPLVSSHPDEQSAPRTAARSKRTPLFIQSLATIHFWQSTCLFITQSETRKPTRLANER